MAYNLKSLIPIIVQIIQLKGFVSVAESFDSGKISTKELVIKDFNLIKNGQKPITINISNWRKNKEIIQKESESILKYLEDYFYENEMTEDYWKTVKFIVQNETFTGQQIGYVVSIVAWTMKKFDSDRKEKVENISKYLGKVNERYETDIKVLRMVSSQDWHGTGRVLVITKDLEGNCIIFSAPKSMFISGKIYHIEGTVQSYKTFRKEKQTILNHVEIKIPDEKKTRSKK